jgi:hypothetical protein
MPSHYCSSVTDRRVGKIWLLAAVLAESAGFTSVSCRCKWCGLAAGNAHTYCCCLSSAVCNGGLGSLPHTALFVPIGEMILSVSLPVRKQRAHRCQCLEHSDGRWWWWGTGGVRSWFRFAGCCASCCSNSNGVAGIATIGAFVSWNFLSLLWSSLVRGRTSAGHETSWAKADGDPCWSCSLLPCQCPRPSSNGLVALLLYLSFCWRLSFSGFRSPPEDWRNGVELPLMVRCDPPNYTAAMCKRCEQPAAAPVPTRPIDFARHLFIIAACGWIRRPRSLVSRVGRVFLGIPRRLHGVPLGRWFSFAFRIF